MNKFWMVWNVGNRAPAYQHFDEHAACKEAERLASVSPSGQIFVVLEAISAVRKNDLIWENLLSSNIPF